VREVRGNTDNDYATSRIVRIDSAESVQFDNNFSPDDARIEGAYRSRRETIIPARLGHTLSGLLVNNIRATLLRPTGGVYWLPDSGLPEWSKIIEAVETASPNSRVYIVRHDMDAESIRAVRDALINELTATCDQLTAQIQSGELGERALASKEREARDLMGKVSAYESILGGGLDSLRTMLSNVETTAANAIMTAAAQAQNRETTGV
jgi:hypothetical protein